MGKSGPEPSLGSTGDPPVPSGDPPDGMSASGSSRWARSDNQFGNWFLANQQMLAAFSNANRTADQRKLDGPRYLVNHVWGEGPHSDNHGGAILPDMLRWIWMD